MTATPKSRQAILKARQRLLQARGQWEPFQPIGPVRDHITTVMKAAGLTNAQFAACAGVNVNTLTAIRQGRYGKVSTEVARKIRAVTPETARPAFGPVDSTGSRRKLQALAWAGWSPRAIAGHAGMPFVQVRRIRDGDTTRITAATARKIDKAFQALKLPRQPPASTIGEKQAARLIRGYADRQGWVSAWAWDDIDDPREKPKGARERAA